MFLWEALEVDCVKKFAYPHWNVFSLASDFLVNKFAQLHSPFYFTYEGPSFTFSLDNNFLGEFNLKYISYSVIIWHGRRGVVLPITDFIIL